MSAMVDYIGQDMRGHASRQMRDSFGATIGFMNSKIVNKAQLHESPYQGMPEMLNDLDALVGLMEFFCRNMPTEDSVLLWSNCNTLATYLKELLQSQEHLRKKEVIRIERCYHKLTIMACVFSFAGDEGLKESLLGEASHEL